MSSPTTSRAALRHQIDRVRRLDQESKSGIEMLHPSSQDCINAARILYCGIANRVEQIDFDVFNKRAKVSPHQVLGRLPRVAARG